MKALNLLPLAICLCLISCNEAKTGVSPKADKGKSLTEKIVYNPLTLHYELEQDDLDPAETRSSTNGSSEEIRSHLERGNAIMDSILNEAMNDPTKKFISVTSGHNAQAVQFQRKENGGKVLKQENSAPSQMIPLESLSQLNRKTQSLYIIIFQPEH